MAENDTDLKTLELKPKQRKAITALVTNGSVPKAAGAANVSERTLYRWLSDHAFRLALADAEGEAIDAATRRLIGLQDSAIGTIEAVLLDEEASLTVRLRASQTVLDYLLKLRELRNVEKRLLALETAAYFNEP